MAKAVSLGWKRSAFVPSISPSVRNPPAGTPSIVIAPSSENGMITSCLSGAMRVQELARSRGVRDEKRPVLTALSGMFTPQPAEQGRRIILCSGADAAHRWWGESDPLLLHTWQRGDRRRAIVGWRKAVADCGDSRKYSTTPRAVWPRALCLHCREPRPFLRGCERAPARMLDRSTRPWCV